MKRLRVIRYIIFSIEIVIAYILQTTPYLLPEVYGGKAVVLPVLALSISVFEPQIPSMIFGAVCGTLTDLSAAGPIGYYSIGVVIICYIVSTLMENYVKTNLASVMIIALACIPLLLFVHFLFYYLFMGYADAWTFFVSHYISRIIYTLALVPVLYGLNRRVSAVLRSE